MWSFRRRRRRLGCCEFVLSLREQGLTQDAVSKIISSSETLLLRQKNKIMGSSFSDEGIIRQDTELFSRVDSVYKQDQFFKESFHLVVRQVFVALYHMYKKLQ